MSHDLPSAAAAKAVALVQMIADQTGGTLSNAQLAPVIRAVAQDLQNGADKAAADEERLTKVETQTRVPFGGRDGDDRNGGFAGASCQGSEGRDVA